MVRTDCPQTRMSPPSKASAPTMERMSVVLPAPFGPTKPKMLPEPTESDTPSTTFLPP